MSSGNRPFQVIDTPQETLPNFTIPQTQDPTCIQDRSEYSYTIGEEGVLVVHFSTNQFTAADGDALPAGTYDLPVYLPEGMIILQDPILDVPTVSAGAIDLEFVDSTGAIAIDEIAICATATDPAGALPTTSVLVKNTKALDRLDIRVELAAAETDISFVLYIPHIVGTGHENLFDYHVS